jgi:hypothetical protein
LAVIAERAKGLRDALQLIRDIKKIRVVQILKMRGTGGDQ